MSAFDDLLHGRSAALQAVLRAAQVVAVTDVTVLLLGESGTGKERMAKAIHGESPRAARPFVAVNCAALPESLAESLLFGHRKGAFTGASRDHRGYVVAADHGTLFLDEVGELPLAVQAKLLRCLESGECLAVGDTAPRHVDVRIVAATNRCLFDQVGKGNFRADLYYRLNVVPLEIPPLRDRGTDLELLLARFTSELAEAHGLEPPSYARDALRALSRYRWPGNVRELRNFAERMLILLSGRVVDVGNLPIEIRMGELSPACPDESWRLPADGLRLDELEVDLIRQALDRTGGNRTRAARLLGLTRDTLLYRLKKYAIHA